ncbi:MAG: 7TM diverse intracellular signaling domain-containing protein [Pseudomonadota bacterium]|nr:7TM diverse intracellular signaling domain-containing protein [Pseudomonadota bacterium]
MRWLMVLLSFSVLLPVVVANQQGHTDGSFSIDIRHAPDSAGLDSIADAIAYDWGRAAPSRVNYGSSPEGHWFHFEIPLVQMTQNERVVVEVHYPSIDHLAFYVVNESGEVTQEHITGTNYAFNSRPIWDDDYSFLVDPALEGRRIYINARTSNSLQMPIRLYSETEFFLKDETNLIIWGAYYGIMLVMALYSLLNGLIIQERLYFYYSVYVLATALFVSALNGHGFAYLWPGHPAFNNASITLFFCVYSGFGLAFAMTLLNARRFNPLLYWLGRVVIAGGTVLGLVSLITLGDYAHYATYLALAFALVMLALGVKSVLDGYYLGWYFIIGWSVLLLSIGIFALNVLGYLPSNILIYHSKEIGSVFEIIVFSLAMSAIYRHEKAECSRINSTLDLMKQRLQKRINIVNNKSGFLEIPQLESHLKDIRDLDRRIHSDLGRILVISVMVIDKTTGRPDYIALGDCLRALFNSRVTVFPFKTATEVLPGEVTVLLFPLHNKFEAEGVIERVEQWNLSLGEQYHLHFGYAISHLTDKYDVDYIEESFHYLEEAVQKQSMSYSIDDTLNYLHRNGNPA